MLLFDYLLFFLSRLYHLDDQMLHTARPPHQADLPPSPAAQPQASPIHSQAISPGSFHHSVPDGGSSLRPVGLEATVGLQHAEEEEELKMSRSSSSVSQVEQCSLMALRIFL